MDSSSESKVKQFLAYSPLIREICEPLFKYFNTDYFNFVRRYQDGSEICLTTEPSWTEYFIKTNFINK